MENLFSTCRFLFLYVILNIHNVSANLLVISPKNNVTYRGTRTGNIEHFQNIKFAHDTSGPRRFAPPVQYVPPPGSEVDASAPGSACPQTRDAMLPFFDETKDMSEDCLNLRIARPQGTTPESRLPVVVWLHGGGVVKGSAYDAHFEPDRMISLSQDIDIPVIYVALNYRLTIFGFARTPLLKDELSLNVGIRDQRAGFQWIKDNIADFGGDPSRITVFGLSAGGTFASLHLMAYGGEQGVPFNQVWAMSGPPGTALNMSSTVTESHTKEVAKTVGCVSDNDVELLRCLREVPMVTLLDAAMQYSFANHPPAGLFTFIPSIDEDLFPDRPSALYQTGRFVKGIPIIFGWTQDDGAMNAGPADRTKDEAAMKTALKGFVSSLEEHDFDELFKLYPTAAFDGRASAYNMSKESNEPGVSVHYFRLAQILRDLLFTCSSIDFGREMSIQSRKLDLDFEGLRLYVLNQSMLEPLWKGAGMPYVGVSHGSDTNYIFNGLFPEGQISESDQQLSRTITEAFIRFASSGDPNDPTLEKDQHWPEAFQSDVEMTGKATAQHPRIQIIGGPLGTGAADPQRVLAPVTLEMDDGTQQVLQGYQMGAMGSAAIHHRSSILAQEKLPERCIFINGLAEKLGI